MLHLVTGGSGSGKSEYGENWLIGKENKDRDFIQREETYLYIATMEPYGEEAKERIKRHRKMRSSKGFLTIECYKDLKKLNAFQETGQNFSGILLECMSNLVANELYLPDGSMKKEDLVLEEVLLGVENLKKQTDRLIIVSNEVTSDGIAYPAETRIYQELLGKINQTLAKQADLVTEVVYGIPIKIKESQGCSDRDIIISRKEISGNNHDQ